MQAEKWNFHRCLASLIGRAQRKIAVDKESNPIKEAEEVLKRPYARVQSIANAWEFLLNGEQAHSAERRLRIEGIKDFIERLNLPICYEDGSPAIRTTGSSVSDVLNRNSFCVSVRSIQAEAELANHPWPLLTSNQMVVGPINETDEWSETELLELFHKSNQKGATGPIKKSQRDLAKEYGISKTRIGELLKKAKVLIESAEPKIANSAFTWPNQIIKGGKRSN